MKQRVLSFVYNERINKFLLLYRAGSISFQEGEGFTLSGKIRENESHEKAIKREIKEELGLDATEIFSLNWGSVYNFKGDEVKEMNFIAFVDSDNVTLNRKYSRYKWLPIEEFISRIIFKDNKILLKKVLEKAIKREVYFDKKERGQ